MIQINKVGCVSDFRGKISNSEMTYTRPDNKQRVFIGIPPDKTTQRAARDLLEPLRAQGRDFRFVPGGNRHLTLAFLGNISAADVGRLEARFDQCYRHQASFNFGFTRLERFPNSRGRIIALTGEASEAMDDLVHRTRNMLDGCGLDFERKKFRPHVTLARIRNPKGPAAVLRRQVQIKMQVDRVVLYRSMLSESGSVYSVLKESALHHC